MVAALILVCYVILGNLVCTPRKSEINVSRGIKIKKQNYTKLRKTKKKKKYLFV